VSRLATRHKIALARAASRIVRKARGFGGRGSTCRVRRRGITWHLDLREGIDFAIFLFGRFEPQTVAAYRRLLRPGDIAIDIGANIGAHTLPLAECVGEGGLVLAYEPTRQAYTRLLKNIEANPELSTRIRADQVMLASTSARPLEPAIYASWPLERSQGAHPLHLGVPMTTEGARARTLDDALEDAAVRRVSLIKLDVDGHELDVLRGAGNTLRAWCPLLIMELAPYTLEERGQNPVELLDLLGKAGYRLYNLRGRPLGIGPGTLQGIGAGASINVIASPREPGA